MPYQICFLCYRIHSLFILAPFNCSLFVLFCDSDSSFVEMSFNKTSFSQHTLYEFLRSNNSSVSSSSANPVQRTPWVSSSASSRPLRFPGNDEKKSGVVKPLERLAKEMPRAVIKKSDASRQRTDMKKGRECAVDKLEDNFVKPPPMFECHPKERRGIKLSHVKGSSPQQLAKLKRKGFLERKNSLNSSSCKVFLSMDDLHRAVLSVDLSDIEGFISTTELMEDVDDFGNENDCLKYDSLEEYKARQSQVLLTETLEGFKQSLISGHTSFAGSPSSSCFSTLNVTVTTAVRKGREWCLLTLKNAEWKDGSSSFSLTQGDIVVMLKPDSKFLEPLLRNASATFPKILAADQTGGSQVLFGIVERTKTPLVSSKKQTKSVQLKCALASKDSPFGYSPSDAGVINSEWTAVILHSLLTVEREWNALCALKELSWFIPTLLGSPQNLNHRAGGSISCVPMTCPRLNESQQEAISAAVSGPEKSITIIQGPPGTGKTHTLVSLLKIYSNLPTVKKTIVCAPSNAAVDELMARFVSSSALGSQFTPGNVVRVGGGGALRNSSAAVDGDGPGGLKRYSLDALVLGSQEKLETERYKAYKERKTKIHADIQKINDDLVGFAQQGTTTANNKSELIRIKERLKIQLDALKERELESVKVERDAIYKKYLREASFVFGTLSSFGADNIVNNLSQVDICVIDEAAQAIEVSALIPLRFFPRRIVLVGDPQQLPAVVKSVAAKRAKLDISLMERLQIIRSVPTHLLCEQYRMDDRIARFPSNEFYQGKLVTSSQVLTRPNPLESVLVSNAPLVFINNNAGGEDIKQGTSLINASEARIVVDLVRRIVSSSSASTSSIGVISPYKQQVVLIRKLLQDLLPSPMLEIDSVDAFQGREKDLILFSCVRSSGNSVGFLADYRRLNVAITRARLAVWLVGNASFLRSYGGSVWTSLVDSCEASRCVVDSAALMLD